jgi:hypothetical protein
MIHLYIYFKQENAKKIYIFAVFLVFVLRKTQLWKITTKEECPWKSRAYWEKTVSSDVSELSC